MTYYFYLALLNTSNPDYSLLSLWTVRAVINETLRLFPSAPIVGRTSFDMPLILPASDTIPSNHTTASSENCDSIISNSEERLSPQQLYLPPRTQVTMLSLLLQRRKDLWGENADEFIPERWLDDAMVEKVSLTKCMYCPFYGGPRLVSYMLRS
jgi:cytochrome P450